MSLGFVVGESKPTSVVRRYRSERNPLRCGKAIKNDNLVTRCKSLREKTAAELQTLLS